MHSSPLTSQPLPPPMLCFDYFMKLVTIYFFFSDANEKWAKYITQIDDAVSRYKPCPSEKCSCHYHLIKKDLSAFEDGISKEAVQSARER